jgi:hypothetical protein
MMGNEVKVKVDKLTKFISTKYFNKLKFLYIHTILYTHDFIYTQFYIHTILYTHDFIYTRF